MDQKQPTTFKPCKARKRKASKSKGKKRDVIKDLRKETGGGSDQSNNEETRTLNIKTMHTKKKFLDLQPVVVIPIEDLGRCRSAITSGSVNGQILRKMDESSLETDFKLKRKHIMVNDDQPSSKKCTKDVKQAVPVIVSVAKRNQRDDVTQEQKSTPSTRKQTSVYSPGSQEEKWQLQILAKGRVTCPKCKSVGRKTVEGIKKHLATCKLNTFTCPDCGKQLKTSTGMKYHLMAEHNNLHLSDSAIDLTDQAVKEKLRKVLKRMGKLKCSKEGCTGSFTSIMGYVYHMKKCGKEESELEKLIMNCKHCGKAYRSRAGLEYHIKNEHIQTPQASEEEAVKSQKEPVSERTQSGRVKRLSAKVAMFHLREIANEELVKEWPKKKVLGDLVPDDRKLKYSRPGLPAFSQDTLRKWKNEVKLHRKVQCPNKGCGCFYTSVSGVKSHLGICTLGEFETGMYKCLICKKEFNSESGVKYHINSIHSQDWFVIKSKAKSSKFDKLHKTQKEDSTKHSDSTSPNINLPKALETWQHRQATGAATTSGTTNLGVLEMKKTGGQVGRKQKEYRQDKDCNELCGRERESSSTECSSSESEAEDPVAHSHDDWVLSGPLTDSGPIERPRSYP